MNNKLRNTIFLILYGLSLNTYADFRVKIPLENIPLNIKDANIIGNASFNPDTINRGESSTLNWNYKYADEIDIEGLGKYNSSGSIILNPLKTTSYKIRAKNDTDDFTDTVTLTVIQPNPNISFTSNSYRIGVGTSTQLNWNVSNSLSVDIDNGIGDELPITGNQEVSPLNTTTYTLKANGYEGLTEQSNLTINVVPNSIISSFSSDKTKVTIGDSVLFSWNVSDSEGLELIPYGLIDKSKTNESILQNAIGDITYSLKTTSLSGVTSQSNPIIIQTYGIPSITDYRVNNSKSINVEANDDLIFNWAGNNIVKYTLDGSVVSGLTTILKAPTATGSKTYSLIGENEAGRTVNDSVSINVVGAGEISTLNAPSSVFINEPFNLDWTTVNLKDLKLTSTTGSGISTETAVSGNTYAITPTSVGNYSYTLKGINDADKETTKSTSVSVESLPTFTGFTVNGQSSITVSPNDVLNYSISGQSNGATLIGRNIGNTANVTNPSTAPTSAGTYIYYGAVQKILNNVTKYSNVRSVSITVVNAPTIGAITAPSNVFANSTFAMSWTGTNATSYSIRGNVVASGVSTTDVDLGATTSRSITPTAAGTYTYTITATNAAGVTTTSTKSVVVESDPTFTGFTVNGGATDTVAPSAALSFVGTGYSSGSTLQGRNSANTADATLPATASSSAGTTTYYAAATKTLNGIERVSSLRSVSVTVVNNPTIGTITAPSNVFANEAFTMSWSGSNVTSYSIRGNSASSGVSTSNVSLGTAISRSITPTAAGTYTYTITATNAAGVTTTSTDTVIVETDPTFSSVTANGIALPASLTLTPNATLNFVSSGLSSGAADILFQDGNLRGMTGNAPATAGTYTYAYTAFKTLNGITHSAPSRSLTLTVANTTPTINSFVATSTYLTSCQNSRLAKFAFSYSNTTSLTLYPPAANGSAQSTSGAKNVTGLTSYTYPNDVPIGKYVYFTLKACNAGNCVSQTLVTSAYDDWGSGSCTSG